jgi:SAM-dependent methyltransferase
MEHVKSFLRKVPFLVRLNHAFFAVRGRFLLWWSHARYRREISLIKTLSLFAPNTSGYYEGLEKTIQDLTLLSASSVFPLLEDLASRYQGKSVPVMTAVEFCRIHGAESEAESLRKIFDSFGCDKSRNHDYHLVYGAVLKRLGPIRQMLEIGLGTTNTDVVSNMGAVWTPGNSLRAFRQFLPGAMIYGADIDRRILFQEERIRTFPVDQTQEATLTELAACIPGHLDLIIDDGLHAPNANIAVLLFSLSKLRPGGWVVIEDIAEEASTLWKIVARLIPEVYETHLISAKGGLVFAVQLPG